MAAKIIVLFVANAMLAFAQDCTCEDEKTLKEATDIFKFLNGLSTETEVSDEVRLPTLPALLSPLVPCGNCVEITRKKRKIIESNTMFENKHSDSNMSEEDNEDDSVAFPPNAGIRHKCPFGFVRIGFMCLSADLL